MIYKNIAYLSVIMILLVSCSDSDSQKTDTTPGEIISENVQLEDTLAEETPLESGEATQLIQSDVSVTQWVGGLDIPWELAFIDDTTALVTQRGGQINKIVNGELIAEPYWEAPSIERGEGGLMGLALHPNYSENGFIYAMFTYSKDFGLTTANKVVRLIEREGKLEIESTILDDIPSKLYHNGGRILFGPDEKLYITTGDASDPKIAQDLDSLGGKILRLNDDGSIPEDNPFIDSPLYSYGHRNPQGLAWNDSGDLFMSTHGPSGEFDLQAKDRVDYITPGNNYGWPLAYGPDQGYPDPLAYWPDTATPPGGMVFWNGSLFLATLGSAALVQLDIQKTDDAYELLSENRWFEGEYGRLRDVTVGPDGQLYILTSNGDGRSGGIGGEDMILKVQKK